MADFSKYLGKLDNNIQDWSKIGKDISDDLQKVLQQRRDDRANIDKKTRKAIDEVNQVELGQNKTFNQFLLNGTGQTKQFMLMQERLLKRGLLKPQDYLNSTQVIKDDWQNLSNAAKSFNADYEEAMKRIQDGDAAGQEAYQNKKYDAFANIQNKSIFVNPVDGRLYLTTSDKEGNIIRDPASMINVNAINARQKDKINQVDVTAEVKKATGALGEVVKAINEGGILTREDKRKMEITVDGEKTTFEDAKNDIIDSLMTSPRNNASILTDAIGGYTFTEIESEKGGKVIYLKEDGLGLLQPELTEEQTKAVRDKLDMEIEKQLGFKETSTYATDVQAKIARERIYKPNADKRKEDGESLNLLADLYYGDADEIDVALKNLRGIETNMGVIANIERTPEGVSITTEGYDPVTFEFEDKTPTEFVESISSEFGINFSDAVKGANIKNKKLNEKTKGSASRTKSFNPKKAKESLKSFAETSRATSEGRKNFEKAFGFTHRPGTYSNGARKKNSWDIISPDGKVVNLPYNGPNTAVDYIEGILSDEQIKQALSRGVFDQGSQESTSSGNSSSSSVDYENL